MTSGLAERYERPVSFASGSEDMLLRQLVGRDQCVLELGCNTGYFSCALAQHGNMVVGLDFDREALIAARRRGIDARFGNLASPGALPRDERFDVVLAANVLEHLPHPERLLQELTELPHSSDLRLIVSVPNVAHVSVRKMLLRGRFEYEDSGIMDRTHLHFFTRQTLNELLDCTGWHVVQERSSPGGLPPTFKGRVLRHLAPRLPQLLAFHLLAEAVRR